MPLHSNIDRLSLKALQDRLNAGLQLAVLQDALGDQHHMVWVPRFRVPAGWFGDPSPPSDPSEDLLLGGFLVDKYLCSPRYAAVEPTTRAVSAPFRLPSVGFASKAVAVAQAAARNLNLNVGLMDTPSPAHIMTLREWGHLAWLVRMLGHDLRGNTHGGRDDSDAVLWQNFAEVNAAGPHYGGTGPLSWFHNRLANGIADLGGNVLQLMADEIAWGALHMYRSAELDDDEGISDADETFVLRDDAGLYPPNRGFAGWPEANGLLRIGTEHIVYGHLVVDPNGYRATVSECQRGAYGTVAAPHAKGDAAPLRWFQCLVPGGYTVKVTGTGLNNTTSPVTFSWEWNLWGHGAHDASPAPGDLLCCDDGVNPFEDLLVTGVSGGQMTVARGQNGTPVNAHGTAPMLVRYSPTMNRVAAGVVNGYIRTLRAGTFVSEMALPGTTALVVDPPFGATIGAFQLWMGSGPQLAMALRGAPHSAERHASVFDLAVLDASLLPSDFVGFRCAWAPQAYQYGGI
ncbi:MAG: hypothetical protein FJ087_01505 [Deltaproteobacteria bacterium]|nr:hypothetical protein [Deltaproteobacteria bacterium]